MNSCSNKEVHGLDLIWIKHFSCYICNASNEIPFLSILTESSDSPIVKEFSQYNLFQLNRISSQDENNFNIQCLSDFPDKLGYNTNDPSEL